MSLVTTAGRHRTIRTRTGRRLSLAALVLLLATTIAPLTSASAAAPSKLVVTLSAPAQQYGTPIGAVAAASINGRPAAGRVRYFFDGNLAAESRTDSSGRTRWNLQGSIPVGTHSLTVYFLPSTAGVATSATQRTVRVTKARPTISVSVPTSKPAFGSWTTMSMAVSAKNLGRASGTVTVSENGRFIGTATLRGGAAQVNFRLSSTPGNNVFSVTFNGSAAIAAGSRAVRFATSRAVPTISVTAASLGAAGGSASVTVRGGPRTATGTVTAVVDGRSVSSATLSGGAAKISIPAQSVRRHQLRIRYSGDPRYLNAVTADRTIGAAANPCSASARACIDLTNNITWIQENGRIIYGPVAMTSGRPGYRTTPGTFSVYWKDIDHLSSIFDSAPMPYAIFFNGGEAFHEGSIHVLSHGCVHLTNAAVRYYWSAMDYGDTVQVFGHANY